MGGLRWPWDLAGDPEQLSLEIIHLPVMDLFFFFFLITSSENDHSHLELNLHTQILALSRATHTQDSSRCSFVLSNIAAYVFLVRPVIPETGWTRFCPRCLSGSDFYRVLANSGFTVWLSQLD